MTVLTTKQQQTIESLRRQLSKKQFREVQDKVFRTSQDIPPGWIDTRKAARLIAALIEKVNEARP